MKSTPKTLNYRIYDFSYDDRIITYAQLDRLSCDREVDNKNILTPIGSLQQKN